MSALGLQLHIPSLGAETLFDELARQDGALIALRYDQPTVPNYGTLGALGMTITDITFPASDIPALGGTCALFNGTSSIISIANNAGFASLTAFTFIEVCAATTSGENSRARFFQMDNGVIDVAIYNINANAIPPQFEARVNRTVNSTYVSAANEIAFPTGAMQVDMSYDETNGITLGKAYLGVYNELTTGVRAIGSGATAAFAAPINIGNNNSFIRTWNGRMYRTLLFNGVLSIARRQQYAQAAGLAA